MEMMNPKAFSGLTEADCIAVQRQLAALLSDRGPLTARTVRTAAGVDLAYWREGEEERAVCCIVVLDCETGQVLEKRHAAGTVSFPYLPGCLAFRELPLVVEAAAQLSAPPDIYLFDGNGILHPRKMGLAAHASFYLDAPTAGIAKHYFRVEGASFTEPGQEAGSWSDIVKDGSVLGRALRTRRGGEAGVCLHGQPRGPGHRNRPGPPPDRRREPHPPPHPSGGLGDPRAAPDLAGRGVTSHAGAFSSAQRFSPIHAARAAAWSAGCPDESKAVTVLSMLPYSAL